jgi:hypothetical protein
VEVQKADVPRGELVGRGGGVGVVGAPDRRVGAVGSAERVGGAVEVSHRVGCPCPRRRRARLDLERTTKVGRLYLCGHCQLALLNALAKEGGGLVPGDVHERTIQELRQAEQQLGGVSSDRDELVRERNALARQLEEQRDLATSRGVIIQRLEERVREIERSPAAVAQDALLEQIRATAAPAAPYASTRGRE